MAIENLKQDIESEKKIIKEIYLLHMNLTRTDLYREEELKIMMKRVNSLLEQLKIINNSIPQVVNSISIYKKLDNKPGKAEDLVKISYTPKSGKEKLEVTIDKSSKSRFLEELSLSSETIERLKSAKNKIKVSSASEFRKAGSYAKFSNKIFQNFSNNLIEKGYFLRLNSNLRKANMPILLVSYLSMACLSSLIALILGVITTGIIFSINPDFIALLRNILIVAALPFITFGLYYLYPSSEKKSIESKINQEIPFMAIHMSAIAGSGIEPTQIFKIIAMSEEYPATREEIKKIINQVNLYGYDLVTALKNTAKETSSRKLSELLNGMAAAISGGSGLSDFLDKRADTLLFSYRLEREKYTKSAETFMDIYISIMIAAPMILTLLLVLLSVSQISIGLSLNTLSIIIVGVISLINIIFLTFLQLNQPSY